MRRLVTAALLVSLSACAPAGQPTFNAAHRAAIVDSVQTMLGQWRAAFNAKDFAKAAAFYSNDSGFRWVENGAVKFRSARELADTMLREAPAFRSLGLSLSETDIAPIAPGVATITTDFSQTITDSAGTTFGLAGAMSLVVVHGDSGWRFLSGHTSVLPRTVDTLKRNFKGGRS